MNRKPSKLVQRIARAAAALGLISIPATQALAGEGTTTTAAAGGGAGTTSTQSIYAIPVERMQVPQVAKVEGDNLGQYKGDVMLIVNVASKCGFTPQYEGLEALYQRFRDSGLHVLGFPSNDFKNQEPGTEEEIVGFCKAKYNTTFPLYAKVHVKGDEKAPLYKHLTAQKGEVGWNFNKFLVGRNGEVIARFDSKVKPDSPELIAAVEKALAEK